MDPRGLFRHWLPLGTNSLGGSGHEGRSLLVWSPCQDYQSREQGKPISGPATDKTCRLSSVSTIECGSLNCDPVDFPPPPCLLLDFPYQISTVVKGQQRTRHEIARTAFYFVSAFGNGSRNAKRSLTRREYARANGISNAAVSAFGHDHQMDFFSFCLSIESHVGNLMRVVIRERGWANNSTEEWV